MSNKIKTREYVVTGTTTPLVDGQVRQVTLVGIVQSVTKQTVFTTENTITKRGAKVTTKVEQPAEYTHSTFSIGMSVLSPADTAIATQEDGLRIARGRALKKKSALNIASTFGKLFSKDIVLAILNAKLAHIVEDPNFFIKVSPAKVIPVAAPVAVAKEILTA